MWIRRSHLLVVVLLFGVASVLLFVSRRPGLDACAILSADPGDGLCPAVTIAHPPEGALFPPDIAAPTFRWSADESACDAWAIRLRFQDGADDLSVLVREPLWVPDRSLWETIKTRSLERPVEMLVVGVSGSRPGKVLARGRVTFATSPDEVGASLFYREVNLPFIEAVKDPTKIRWRFGSISSEDMPPVVLENVPVCGNCHSFPTDASLLAMDVDYANSKGSYVVTRVAEEMTLPTSDIITWNDYHVEDGEQTFGLLSQISPDGRYVVSTVKDRSVFVPMPALAFSQLFFPIKGILCIYDRHTQQFAALPGADDPRYVQSNPTWSPDGKYIVFARSEAYRLRADDKSKVLLSPEDCAEFVEEGKPFLYDLYRIAFNEGRGGVPEPIPGASGDGMSNYFARYSPDGKWIVFCKAKSYMLLQPDSQLHIIPAAGGEPRRLEGNTARMNSWHSFSPNGRWLVFSSKAGSDYTQLFLTHIDEAGHSSPAICLSHLTASDRAANIPEFVNAAPTAIRKIHEQFLNDYSFVRAADAFFRAHDTDGAIREYRKALELNPQNVWAHRTLGFLLFNVKEQYDEGLVHLQTALELDRRDPRTHHDLGMALLYRGQLDSAAAHLRAAIKGMPHGLGLQYDAIRMRHALGQALLAQGRLAEAVDCMSNLLRLDPNCAEAHYGLALALAGMERPRDVIAHYTTAVRIRPEVDNSPMLHDFIAGYYVNRRAFKQALAHQTRALELAKVSGDPALIGAIEERLRICRQLLTAAGAP